MNTFSPPPGLLGRLVHHASGERMGLLGAFACGLSMFTAYSMLRPVRETMGINAGVSALPALFWATFVAMLVAQPVYGWVVSRWPRSHALPAIYAFFALTLLGFYGWFFLVADHSFLARAFFVWISVFNLLVVAVFWGLMAEVFNREQAGRLFGFIAGGLSLGGLIGPVLASELAPRLGSIHLLLIAAALMLLSAALMRGVINWHRRHAVADGARDQETDGALQGGAFAGFAQVLRSPYLRAVALFVLLLTSVSTVLYLEQQRVVAAAISDPDARTALFARIDFFVQATAMLLQFALFSRLLRRFGFATTLAAIPALMLFAFALLSLGATLQTVIATIVLRRIGEYAVTRPCRDMLMSVVDRAEKYKAKGVIDTFVYRGGDALSASLLGALSNAAATPAAAALAGVLICALWLACALWLGRQFERRAGIQSSVRAVAEPRGVRTNAAVAQAGTG